MSFPAKWHILSLFLMPVIQCIVVQWRHISSESAVALLLHLCSICSHILIFVAKYDAQSKAWDILLVLTSVAGNLCNKCPSSYSNKTAVKVILSMRSLVSIEQQSPRRPCDTNNILLLVMESSIFFWYLDLMPILIRPVILVMIGK